MAVRLLYHYKRIYDDGAILEACYAFVSVERLLDDFFTDVDALRKP